MGQVREETVRGAKWILLQKLTLQPMQFVYGIILARLITPTEMGILGLTSIFFAIAGTLATAGFGTALIRKIDRTEEDCNTMFWFNLGMSALMAIVLFLLAPWFVEFYRQPELLWLTRCSALLMLLGSSAGVHWALYSAKRDFKTPSLVGMAATIAAMPVGISMAYMGFGVWALMAQQIASTLISLCAVWAISPWKPRFCFSTASFRNLFGFGSKMAISGIIHTFYGELRTFIIGRFYSPAALGLYGKGAHLAGVLPRTLTGTVMTVSFPVLATLQDDLPRLARVYRTYIRTCTLPIAWACLTLAALAQPLVNLLYGEMWLPSAIFVQLVALSVTFDHISVINLNLLQVLGRSDLFLRLEIIKKTISIGMLLYAATISVEAICWAMVIYEQVAIVCNCYYTGKLIGINWWRQMKDYAPFYLLAAMAAAPGYAIAELTDWDSIVRILLGGSISFALYFGYLTATRNESLRQYLSILMGKPRLRKAFSVIPLLRRLASWAGQAE